MHLYQNAAVEYVNDELYIDFAGNGPIRELIDAMPHSVWITYPDGLIDYSNIHLQAYDGVEIFEKGPWQWTQVVFPDDRESTLSVWEEACRTGEPLEIEHRLRMKDGTVRWHITHGKPRRDKAGNIVRWYFSATDIHRNRQSEDQLSAGEEHFLTAIAFARESELRYTSLFENNHTVMLLIDPETEKIIDGNPAACRFYGYSREELRHKKITDINISSSENVRHEMDRAIHGEKRQFSFQHRLASGEVRWVTVQSGPIDFGDKKYLCSIVFDISESHAIQVALQESERLHRNLVEQSSDGIYLTHLAGPFVEVNPQMCIMLGYSREELLRLGPADIISEANLKERPLMVEEIWNSAGQVLRYEREYRRKDGTVFPVEVSARLIDGGLVLGTFRDITDRKQAVHLLRHMNAQLEQLVRERTVSLEKRNHELQSFAFVASHDLQEPLRKIRMFADLMRSDCGHHLDENGHSYLDRMEAAATRMQQLLTEVLDYARITSRGRPKVPVHFQTIALEALDDVDQLVKETGAQIELEGDIVLHVDPGQLRQLLNHLILNALTFHAPDQPPQIRIHAQLEGDTICLIVVEDEGIGFDQKYTELIFEPFQQLHPKGEYPGTGMGLAICRRIAERHGGSITAESTPGEGTRFVIRLPVRKND